MNSKGMFLFRNRSDATDVRDRLARLTNLTTPNLKLRGEERRATTRANRSLPVVLAAWEDDAPVAEEATTAITKDLGDTGISVILRQPLHMERLVLGFWMPDEPGNPVDGAPMYVLAEVVSNTPLGGGFWQCGVQAEKLLLESQYPALEQLESAVRQLAPPRHALDAVDS